MAPSPGIFLSSVAQRTRRLHFGPLVYPIALYHPLRLLEEIAMLDHLSGGRFEFGIGKGASPIELKLFGAEAGERAPGQFDEARAILMQGFTGDVVDFHRKFYDFTDVPIELRPLQRPHPPIWYGVSAPHGALRAAGNRYNFVGNIPAALARQVTDAYRSAWNLAGNAEADLPLMGIGRFVVVANTEAEAVTAASRAYRAWNANFWNLWDARGGRPAYFPLPNSFEESCQYGIAVAGTPHQVLDTLAAQAAEAGVNYLVCRFAFGDLTLAESMRSIELFVQTALPSLTAMAPKY